MNKERMHAVADSIEAHAIAELGFNMGAYFYNRNSIGEVGSIIYDQSGHDCGTVACLAGHTVAHAFGVEALHDAEGPFAGFSAHCRAQQYLWLTDDEADCLFAPVDFNLANITQEQAVKCLRTAADTGVIDYAAAGATPVVLSY